MKKLDNLVTPDPIDRFFEPAHLVEMLSALASRRAEKADPVSCRMMQWEWKVTMRARSSSASSTPPGWNHRDHCHESRSARNGWTQHARNIFASGSTGFRKTCLQSLFDVIEFDDDQIRIDGSGDPSLHIKTVRRSVLAGAPHRMKHRTLMLLKSLSFRAPLSLSLSVEPGAGFDRDRQLLIVEI